MTSLFIVHIVKFIGG